jgi:hypothetical protein
MNTSQALEKLKVLKDDEAAGEDVAMLASFLERSERGVIK